MASIDGCLDDNRHCRNSPNEGRGIRSNGRFRAAPARHQRLRRIYAKLHPHFGRTHWVDIRPSGRAIKRDKPVPELVRLGTNGEQDPQGLPTAFTRAPFQFCLNPACGVAYNARQTSDVGKLSTIGVDGRSTATTILALSTILKLRTDSTLEPEARKLLSFTDNRQDASLQAGHFNDFVEVSLVRSGLYRAMARFGRDGIRYDELVHHVERALNLPTYLYAGDPELRGPALEETRRALRSVLAYFLYRDLERGWRVTSPNLEQCGLLEFEYLAIDEVAGDQTTWHGKDSHAALTAATPEQRKDIIRVLLDHLRRSLTVKEDSLNSNYQERISEQSRQRLRDPWVIEDSRDMVRAGVAWPRPRMEREHADDVFISPRSNFGQFLRRPGVLPDLGQRLSLNDTGEIILSLFRCLKPWGLIEEVRSPREGSLIAGYQVPSSVMIWKAGDGTRPMFDPLRITRQSEAELKGNAYFIELYKSFADFGSGLEGREHTAQVQSDIRQEREEDFRSAELPILFCSPTMELGVDISQLNVVNMRNVPPTPANYAQRSGRAGRGGQPAFVYTYCSGFSPHDQYYFKKPQRMVAGSVTAPRLDLLNRDLVEAHVHAIWLSEAKLNLGTTLAEKVLTVTEDDLALPLKADVQEKLADASAKLRAQQRARRLLASIGPELLEASWYREDWLNDVFTRLPQRFDEACNRWRSLYRAAVQQRQLQNRIIGDHSRPQIDRDRAKALRAQAESQITLLREDADYEGVRVTFQAHLGRARVPMQIDLGFGDVMTPAPELTKFPTLLEFAAPVLYAYSRETTIAEKFEAMTKLGELNSRMKDFFDIWLLSRQFTFDGETLRSAIERTFANRQSAIVVDAAALSDGFAALPGKEQQWQAFVNRSRITGTPATLREVVGDIRAFLQPVVEAAAAGLPFNTAWHPGTGWGSA